MFKKVTTALMALLALSTIGTINGTSSSAKQRTIRYNRNTKIMSTKQQQYKLPTKMNKVYQNINFGPKKMKYFEINYHYASKRDKRNLYKMTMLISKFQNNYYQLQHLVNLLYQNKLVIK